MVSCVVDAAFGAIFDEVFEKGEAFEDDAPGGWAGGFNSFPHEFGYDEDLFFVEGTRE